MKQIVPYLLFDGQAEEALYFYKDTFHSEILAFQKFGEADYPTPKEAENRVMHARLKSGDFIIYMSDTFPDQPYKQGNAISLAIELESDEEMKEIYNKLKNNGQVFMEMQKTFWGATYAKVQDKFGIVWDLNCQTS
jgi:PhnB protein